MNDASERLSITRQPPDAPELWRDAYARIAAQYAVFLERYDLAEDAQAEDIIAVIEAKARPNVATLAAALAVVFAYNASNASVAPNGSLAFGEGPTSYWRDRAEGVLAALREQPEKEQAGG